MAETAIGASRVASTATLGWFIKVWRPSLGRMFGQMIIVRVGCGSYVERIAHLSAIAMVSRTLGRWAMPAPVHFLENVGAWFPKLASNCWSDAKFLTLVFAIQRGFDIQFIFVLPAACSPSSDAWFRSN